ncbi:unnamed protein product [Cladocopium goreaui]|uniref:Myosin-6 n=1 Tax=Cladocopium goreaui TaxID=2562237 RepID=A0A9P1G6A9_9DINO|nr:unnamed protein product [Cladocopium goreaui]
MRSRSRFQVNDLVYVPCQGKAVPFSSGVVVEVTDQVVVLTDDGCHSCAPDELRLRFDGESCQDNTSLVYLNDASILQNLKARHQEDAIYTYTASVLLAVNPYHNVEGLYSQDQCARYRGKHIGALPPHPYAIADAAYRALVREHKNQAFIISGESGAGKTETAKIVMQYLGFVSGSSSSITAQIQQRILQAQPILESFGNAVTMRNNNSSRFGKYNRIFFDETGTLVDAGVTTYLLESSRVVTHGNLERSYHCFYEMLSGLAEEKLSQWQLSREKQYIILSSDTKPSEVTKDQAEYERTWHIQFQERDQKNFQRLCDALRVVGFSEEDMDSIFQVLAGLVHLGDLSLAERDEGQESSSVELDEEILEKAAGLLGMDADELSSALRRRKVRVLHPGRESVHEVPRTTSQFRHALHSLIKALYKRLFERLVDRINGSFQELSSQSEDDFHRREIGILDIYGFERLQRNSFEQLCINLANERLQQYFVENVLMAEQDLYRREGLPWPGLVLPDSSPVVSAIGHTFRILDEYSQQLAKGFEKTDESFCQKTVDEAQKDPARREFLRQLRVSKRRPTAVNEGFMVKHYAGLVEYNTKGWLDKNNDRLLPDCEELIGSSSFELVASLKDEDMGKAPFRSISKKYCTDLENLLQTLSSCQLHYIRCFKPNDFQKAGVFDETLVLDQIVQCGTVELVKLMHDGYPNRCRFQEMLRFRDLLPESFQRYGTRTFIEALLLAYDVPVEDWALGMSRVFLRAGQLKALEDLRSAGAAPDPEKLKIIMRQIIRKKWVRAVHAIGLCRYLPEFLAAIRLKRAEQALATKALLVGRLHSLLEAARSRLWEKRQRALRRWRVAFYTVSLARSLMVQARARRLQKAMRKFWLLRTRLHEWATNKAEEAVLEAERRAAEEERLEAERQKAEEQARQAEARRRAEEEARLECCRAENEERRMPLMDVPSPCRSSPRGRQLQSYEAVQVVEEPEEDPILDVNVSDLEGNLGPFLKNLLERQCQLVEKEVEKRQNALISQMDALMDRQSLIQARMDDLDRHGFKEASSWGTPPRAVDTPPIKTSPFSSATQEKARRFEDNRENLAEQRQYLMADLHNHPSPVRRTPRTPDTGSVRYGDREKCLDTFRRSVAVELDEQPYVSTGCITPEKEECTRLQREWWGQQRRYLMKELEKDRGLGGHGHSWTPPSNKSPGPLSSALR